jgi:catecholate siderophore receptor
LRLNLDFIVVEASYMFRTLVLAASLVAAAVSPAAARPDTDSISAARTAVAGTVVDASGAAIPRVQVVVSPAASPVPVIAVTNERGEFVVALAPGRYTVTALADGFEPISQVVEVGARPGAPLRLQLTIAALRETVTVTAPPAGYDVAAVTSSTKTVTPLRDVPQSVTVVTRQLIQDQLMMSVADVVRYVPGIAAHQGENNRDQVIIRGNNSSADFYVDGVRDDVQYYRDLYNLERVEALKGPNAMIFGRGGGGGVVNRVSKEAGFAPVSDFGLVGGSFGARRLTADVGRPVNGNVAFRVNAVYEQSDSFREFVERERYGINPTFTVRTNSGARFTFAFDHFRDDRVADRGVPSYQGRPVDVDPGMYFGNPDQADVHAAVDAFNAGYERRIGRATLRNRTVVGKYDRGYQNFVPGAVGAGMATVAMSAYNNKTGRVNVFNQTDLTSTFSTGAIRHVVLAGAEVGRQNTDNFRNTGYFANGATTIAVPFEDPNPGLTTFRQSATDADNHVRATVAAAYVQDQAELSKHVQVVGGLRLDTFNLQYHNNRNGDDLDRRDNLVSPRAGVVFKPIVPMSIYGSYTVSYLPGSGDQFSSLTVVTEQLEPEKFTNYEIGAKWDVRPSFAFTTAVYRLDRTNTRSTDPNDPTRIVQTGSQRTNGFEAGMNGRVTEKWQIAGGYAFQDAFVTSATAAARAGARVAQVPRHSVSLWNTYQVVPRLSVAAGIIRRTDVFAAIDNTVVLPAYVDVDAAAYLSLTARTRLQLNVGNMLDRRYFLNADNNNNITPASPRSFKIALVTKF